jgi:hypothetical protein
LSADYKFHNNKCKGISFWLSSKIFGKTNLFFVDRFFFRVYSKRINNIQKIEYWSESMSLEERLGILRSGNVISMEVLEQVRRVIARLGEHWGINLTEETGGRMITHLAMALMRISRGEEIAAPERDLLDEFRNTPCFPQAVEITKDLSAWANMRLPEAEGDYLIINICLILDAENDA